jgi:hypothetical protein
LCMIVYTANAEHPLVMDARHISLLVVDLAM